VRILPPGVRVTGNTLTCTSPAAISSIIAMQAAGGEAFRIPLFRAAAAGVLAVASAVGGTPIPARILKQRHPTVVLLADDHPGAIGPEAWPQARKLARWAPLVALHATGGQPEHYAMFAAAAVHHGRLLVVEIELRHLAAWRDLMLLERKPGEILCLTPRPGGQHPISPAQAGEAVH
jgi:hypothetical protein